MEGKREGMKERMKEGSKQKNEGKGVKGMKVFSIEEKRNRVKEGGTVGRNKRREEEGKKKERKAVEYKK